MIRFFVILLMILTASAAQADDDQSNLPRGAELVGIARAETKDLTPDQHLKGELDLLVPKLKQVSSYSSILIESYFPDLHGKGKDDRIRRAFSLAEQVELYLKNRHGLQNTFFIAIWEQGNDGGTMPKIRITTYPKDFFEN